MSEAALFNVVDLGVGMSAALAAQMLGHVGGRVTRIEPEGRDPFHQVYPAYAAWRRGSARAERAQLDTLLADADIVVIGGEDYPGLDWRFDADDLSRRYPRLVVVRIDGYATADAANRPGVDLLVQARTGLVNEEYSNRPRAMSFPMPTYGAAMLAVLGALAALVERDRSGKGQVVATSLQQGAGLWVPGVWSHAEKADAAFRIGTPKDVRQPVFRCKDGKYLILMVGTPGVIHGIYKTLGIDIEADPKDRGLPDISRGPVNYFLDRSIVEPGFAAMDREAVLEGLWACGVAADAVLPVGGVWDDEQTTLNRLVEPLADGGRAIGNPLQITEHPAKGAARSPTTEAAGDAPLSGLRVVDLGAYVAGPFAGKILADLGAEAIKIEPLGGEVFRFMYRNFSSVNRGKRSLAVDMKAAEGIDLVRRICASSDAITHNLRMGVAERLGIGGDALRGLNPQIVTVHCSAYGPTGPKALNSGWDPVLQPYTGHAIRAGGTGNDPFCYQIPILDYGTGVLAAIAVLAGVLRRDQHGAAVDVHTSLLATGLYMLSEAVQLPDGSFAGAPDLDAGQTGFHPAERLFQAADGWIAVAARSEAMATDFAGVLGLKLGARAGWGEAEAVKLEAAIRALPAAELLAKLDAAGVWAEAVTADAWEALRINPHAKDIGLVAEGQDARYGLVSALGQLMTFSRSPLERDLKPFPAPGEDSRALAAGAGLAGAEIDALYERKVLA